MIAVTKDDYVGRGKFEFGIDEVVKYMKKIPKSKEFKVN